MNLGVRRVDLPAWAPLAMLLALGVLLYVVRGILPPFVVAMVLAYLLGPVVTWVQRYFHLSRVGSLLLLALIALSPISAAWFWFIPPLIVESQSLAEAVPGMARAVFDQFFGDQVATLGVAIPSKDVAALLVESARGLIGLPAEPALAARAALEFFASSLLALVVLAYLLVDGDRLVRAALNLVPTSARLRLRLVIGEADGLLLPQAWGLVALFALEVAATWLAFGWLYRLPFALPVALTAALLGLVPFVGPLAAALFVALIGLGHGSLELALGAAVFYVLMRQVETHLLAPRMLTAAATPHPVVAIFAPIAGAALAGLFGALVGAFLAVALKALMVAGEVEEPDASVAETSLMPAVGENRDLMGLSDR